MHTNLSAIHPEGEHLAEARRLMEEALEVSEELGNSTKCTALHGLGYVLTEQGDYSQAHLMFEKAITLAREAGNHYAVAFSLDQQGRLAMIWEDYTAAHRYLEEVWHISNKIGLHFMKIDALCYRGTVWANEAKFEEAHQYLEESLVLCLKGGLRNLTANSLLGVAQLLTQVWQKRGEAGQPEKVAMLCGEICGLVGSPAAKVPSLVEPFRSYYKQAGALARSKLDETAFREAFAKGEGMSLEEAGTYARQVMNDL